MKKKNRKIVLKMRILEKTLTFNVSYLSYLSYLRENLGVPFFIGCQVLLLACVGLLIQRNSDLANEVAVYAFYLLAIGVVLQLISFWRYEKRE